VSIEDTYEKLKGKNIALQVKEEGKKLYYYMPPEFSVPKAIIIIILFALLGAAIIGLLIQKDRISELENRIKYLNKRIRTLETNKNNTLNEYYDGCWSD
jgi:hypothetical protein